MGLLGSLNTSAKVEQEKDVLGGTSFNVESGIDEYVIETAYMKASPSGAIGLFLNLKSSAAMLRQTLWIQSGDKKGNKTFYTKDGKDFALPGFTVADNIANFTNKGKGIGALATAMKTIKLYSHDHGKEVNTDVEMVTDLCGKTVCLAIMKITEDKTAQNPQTKQYEPTGETRDVNEIDKVFRVRDGLTISEIMAGGDEDTFRQKWDEKYTGVTKMKAKGAKTAVAGSAQKAASVDLFADED